MQYATYATYAVFKILCNVIENIIKTKQILTFNFILQIVKQAGLSWDMRTLGVQKYYFFTYMQMQTNGSCV